LFFDASFVQTATFTASGGPALITINGAAKNSGRWPRALHFFQPPN
jgi:hypothetical protein